MTVAKNQRGQYALDELLETIQPRLRGVLATFRIPYEDAEDLLQQTMLAFLVKRDEVHDPSRWLMGTLRNRCLMYWRSYRRRVYDSVDEAILETLAAPGRPAQEQVELATDLNTLVRDLSPRCQSILRLRYGLGCDPAETAQQLGYRNSSIYKITERCLAGLTRKLVAAGYLKRNSADKRSL